MNSKAEILAKIRNQSLPQAELPEQEGPWIHYDDPVKQFSEVLAAVGGEAICVADAAELLQVVAGLKCLIGAQHVVSPLADLRDLQTFQLDDVDDPHEVDVVDVAILPGQIGVAENGAVWVDGGSVKQRVIYFLTQHLVLVVPRSAIVHNMHEAFERISFPEQGYGLFISGPSKTADIEQSLVIGAHGPRSMTAILLG